MPSRIFFPCYVSGRTSLKPSSNNTWDDVIKELTYGCLKDSGIHLLIDAKGSVHADRMMQQNADAVPRHNVDSIAIGVLTRDDGDHTCFTLAQEDAAKAVLTTLHGVFPKARLVDVEKWNRRTANVREPKDSIFYDIFSDLYDEEEGGDE